MAVLGFKTYKNDDITTFSVFELFMFVFYYSIKSPNRKGTLDGCHILAPHAWRRVTFNDYPQLADQKIWLNP